MADTIPMDVVPEKVYSQEYSSQIDYEEKVYNHPSPLMVKITPVGGGTSPNLSLTAAGTLSEFQIPSKVVNLSRSYISADLAFPASGDADTFVNLSGNLGDIIDRIVVSTIGSNTILADISNVGNFLEAVDAPSTKLVDFLDKAGGFSTTLPTTADDAKSCPVSDITRVNAATNPAGAVFTSGAVGDDNGAIYTGVKSVYSTAVANGASYLSVKLPLSMFKSTILAVDKEFYFSGEALNIAIYWSAVNTYAWGAKNGTSIAATPISLPSAPTMSGLALYASVEQNTILTSRLVNKVNTEGLTLPIPVVWSSKQAITSANPSINLNITRSHGNSLLWVAWAPFNGTESGSTCKSHTTYPVSQYNTYLNSIPVLTNSGISVEAGEQYLYNKENIVESAIQSQVAYNNRFTHFDNFSGFSLPDLQDNLTLTNGIDLTREAQQWQLQATLGTSTALNHYIFWATQKQLLLTRSGVVLV